MSCVWWSSLMAAMWPARAYGRWATNATARSKRQTAGALNEGFPQNTTCWGPLLSWIINPDASFKKKKLGNRVSPHTCMQCKGPLVCKWSVKVTYSRMRLALNLLWVLGQSSCQPWYVSTCFKDHQRTLQASAMSLRSWTSTYSLKDRSRVCGDWLEANRSGRSDGLIDRSVTKFI